MLQKLINKLGSRRFQAWVSVLMLKIFSVIDDNTFMTITAFYIGSGAVEKIFWIKNGKK